MTINGAGQGRDLEPAAAPVAAALFGVSDAVFAVVVIPHGDLLSLDVRTAVSGRV